MSNYLYSLGKDLILRKTPLTIDPPHEDMVVDLVTALSEPVTIEPNDVLGEIYAAYRRLEADDQCRRDPPPIVAPERLERHWALAETPLPRWVAIRHRGEIVTRIDRGQMSEYHSWVPASGSLGVLGIPLLRTGQYAIWEDEASPVGYQVAEILDTVT